MVLNAAGHSLFFVHIFISSTPNASHSSAHVISDIEQSERSEIKVQNIQGTRGSEGPWKVFLKTHPYNIYKKWTYAMELFRAAIKSPATCSWIFMLAPI